MPSATLLRLRQTLVADNTASSVATRGPDIGNATGLSVTSNGYTLAPIVARMTAELMIGGRSDLDASRFTLARF